MEETASVEVDRDKDGLEPSFAKRFLSLSSPSSLESSSAATAVSEVIKEKVVDMEG